MRTPRILLITDPAYEEDAVLRAIDEVSRAVPEGAFAVQLRDKTRPTHACADWAFRLRAWTLARRVPLVVNGDVALARAVAADGVHFGAGATAASIEAASGLWRSTVAHVDQDIGAARLARLDAVLVSPIFETPGKGAVRGVGALARALSLADGALAVIALGGVDVGNAPLCFSAGAYGVAMIRGLLRAGDPAREARGLLAGLPRS
jgi:thiamine-phosphate pyrophosphorylase